MDIGSWKGNQSNKSCQNHMNKALKDNVPLPYSHLITDIFDQFHIPLEDEPFVKHNKRIFKIGAEIINSFDFVKNIHGQWVHKRDFDGQPIHDEHTSSPPLQAIQDVSFVMLNDIMHEICDLRAFVGTRFDNLDSRIG